MQEKSQPPTLQVSNPMQAASEIFYNPRPVFNALGVRNNWSWVPFIILSIILFIPPYLYFGIVDFDWWLQTSIVPNLEDLTPALQESTLAQYSPNTMQLTTGLFSVLSLVLMFLIFAFYLSMMTRNDEKSVHGFTDWYGACWWIAMPAIVNALIALVLLTLQDSGAQMSITILSPLSLAYMFGTEASSPWFNLLTSVRLDSIWSIALGAICLMSWTAFSQTKAIIISLIPSLLVWVLALVGALNT